MGLWNGQFRPDIAAAYPKYGLTRLRKDLAYNGLPIELTARAHGRDVHASG
jgi:hypothetical protein